MIKRKGLLTVVFMIVAIMMLAITAFAVNVTVEFYNGNNLDTSVGRNGELSASIGVAITLPSKPVEHRETLFWYTEDGRAYEANSKVYFTENVKLYQMKAKEVDNADDFKKYVKAGTPVCLVKDITVEGTVGLQNQGQAEIFLNGHNITVTGKNIAFSEQRSGLLFYGSGTVSYSGDNFKNAKSHSYDGHHNILFVGRDVIIDAPNATMLFDGDGATTSGYPLFEIYGTVKCKSLLRMENSNQRKPEIHIYETANVTISGTAITHTALGNTVKLFVHGGIINETGKGTSLFADGSSEYKISGGAFKFSKATDNEELESFAAQMDCKTTRVTINSSEYIVVIPKTCKTPAYSGVFKENASCAQIQTDLYSCQCCDYTFLACYGSVSAHQWEKAGHLEPTYDALGWDRYACKNCWHSYYEYLTYDISGLPVKVIVNTSGTLATVDTAIKNVFTYTTPDKTTFVITGVKAFGEYKIEDIVGIYIPKGVTRVSISSANENTSVKELIFNSDCSVIATDLKGLTALEVITLGGKVSFTDGCAPNSLTTIKSPNSGADTTFDKNCFKDKTNLTEFEITAGNIYKFAEGSFRNTGIKKLIFSDNAKVSFDGVQAFYGCVSLEEIYIGKGITSLNNKPFDCCNALKFVFIWDVNVISEYAFCTNNDSYVEKCQLVVYCHYSGEVNIHANAFANRNNYGVKLFFISTNITSFNNCKYELHYGVPHENNDIKITEATCTSVGRIEHVTNCPCGISKSSMYKLYKNGVEGYEVVEQYTRIIPKLPHSFASILSLKYDNGFDAKGEGVYECTVCKLSETKNTLPIVTFRGYSVSENGEVSMVAGYFVDSVLAEEYKRIYGSELEFGMVVAVKKAIGDKLPLDENGNAVSNSVIKFNMTGCGSYDGIIKLRNLSQTLQNTEFIMAGYIIKDGEVIYIQNGNGALETVTCNSL